MNELRNRVVKNRGNTRSRLGDLGRCTIREPPFTFIGRHRQASLCVVFHRLSREHIRRIVEIQLSQLRERYSSLN